MGMGRRRNERLGRMYRMDKLDTKANSQERRTGNLGGDGLGDGVGGELTRSWF